MRSRSSGGANLDAKNAPAMEVAGLVEDITVGDGCGEVRVASVAECLEEINDRSFSILGLARPVQTRAEELREKRMD